MVPPMITSAPGPRSKMSPTRWRWSTASRLISSHSWMRVYRKCDVSRFQVKIAKEDEGSFSERDKLLAARMHKAITMILFKLEGQKIRRNPSFHMDDRLLLDKGATTGSPCRTAAPGSRACCSRPGGR